MAAASRACRLTILWRDAAVVIVVRSPGVGCALSSSCAPSARVPPLVEVEVLAGDGLARRDDDGMTRSGLRGWESTQRQTALGAVESERRVRLVQPVVDSSVDGASDSRSAYWRQVERFTFGLVRSRQGIDGVERGCSGGGRSCWPSPSPSQTSPRVAALLLPDHRPDLLATNPAARSSSPRTRSATGRGCITITGFFPALAARQASPTGPARSTARYSGASTCASADDTSAA